MANAPFGHETEHSRWQGAISDPHGVDIHCRIVFTDRMFMLILESGAQLRGVAGDSVDRDALGALWGHAALVQGVAKFRPSGSLLRIEAERVEVAGERNLSLWAAPPTPGCTSSSPWWTACDSTSRWPWVRPAE